MSRETDMAIYKTRWFDRWARKQGLDAAVLKQAVQEMTAGLYEADLGSGLLKSGSPGQGRAKVAAFARWLLPTKQTAGTAREIRRPQARPHPHD